MPRKKVDDGSNPPKRSRKKKTDNPAPVENMKIETSGPIGPSGIMPFDQMPMATGGPGMHMQHNNGGGGVPMGIMGCDDPQRQMNHLGAGPNPNNGMPSFSEYPGFYQPHQMGGPPIPHPSQGLPPGAGPPMYAGMPPQQQQRPPMSIPQQQPPHPQTSMHFNGPESQGMPGNGNFSYQQPMCINGPSNQNGPLNGQIGAGHPMFGPPMGNMPPPMLEYRITEMNRKFFDYHHHLPLLSPIEQARWWDAFSFEFFDDDAKITIIYFDVADMVFRKYSMLYLIFINFVLAIGRLLIPRFYRTIFDNGVCELYYIFKNTQERLTNAFGPCALDSEEVLMVTRVESQALGCTASPRDALNTLLFEQYRRSQQYSHVSQQMNAGLNQIPIAISQTPNPEDTTNKKQPKKRQRKSNTNPPNSSPKKKPAVHPSNIMPTGGNGGPLGPPQCTPPPQVQQNMVGGNFPPNNGLINSVLCQDMLVVTEPSLMGCEYGVEHLRDISRLKNPNAFDQHENNNQSSINGVSGNLLAPQSVPSTSTTSQQHQPPQSTSTPSCTLNNVYMSSSQSHIIQTSSGSQTPSQLQTQQHIIMQQQSSLENSSMITNDFDAQQVKQMASSAPWMGSSSTSAILTIASTPTNT